MKKKSEYQVEIIEAIKRIREEKDISQAEASKILGISRGQMGNIESTVYQHKYTLKQMYILCKSLGYPIEKVFLPDIKVSKSSSKVIDEFVKKLIEYEE